MSSPSNDGTVKIADAIASGSEDSGSEDSGADLPPSHPEPTMDNPDVSVEALNTILESKRAEVLATGRSLLVVVLTGLTVEQAYIVKGKPRSLKILSGAFKARVLAVWKTYDTAGVIPVILTRTTPTPFTGLKLAVLPWAPPSGQWCPECGKRLPAPGAGQHRC